MMRSMCAAVVAALAGGALAVGACSPIPGARGLIAYSGGATYGALEVAVLAGRRIQALEPMVQRVVITVAGPNVPGTPSIAVTRDQFEDDRAVVTWVDLLPGPILVGADVRDAADRTLGRASGQATISADETAVMVLGIVPATGTAQIAIDGPILPTPGPAIPDSLAGGGAP